MSSHIDADSANMQLAENKERMKRKGEKRDQCCAWEVWEDDGMSDELHGYQTAKQKVHRKCRYLDDRSVTLSPHLFIPSRFDISGTSDGANTRWKTSLLNSVPAKPSSDPEVNLIRTAAPDHSVPINPSISTDSMTQKQNIVPSKNSTPLRIIGVSEGLPMIEWTPTSSHVQPSEETAGRCIESLSANHETRSPAWKRASVRRLERCHECPAREAHLGLPSGTNGPYAARPRVIRRVVRVNGGYRAAPSQGHVEEKNLCPLCPYRLPDHPNVLHNSCYKTGNQIYECLCSSLHPRARHSQGEDQKDATILEKKEQLKQEFTDVIKVMDTQCQSGWQRNAETPPSPHHVTFSHILQVLQSKPANFPEVRGQRRHRAL